jgi:hypothetical protein
MSTLDLSTLDLVVVVLMGFYVIVGFIATGLMLLLAANRH